MRKTSIFAVFVIFFGWGASAQAALIDNGDGTVTDTDAGLMWLQDSTLNQEVSWDEANAWAASLTTGGFDDWRLPSALTSSGAECSGSNCTDTEFGSLFYAALGNTAGALTNSGIFTVDLNVSIEDKTWFWTATNPSVGLVCNNPWWCAGLDSPYYFRFETGEQLSFWENAPLNAWAVRTVNTEVPEPPVWAIMGLGLLVIGRQRIKKQRL